MIDGVRKMREGRGWSLQDLEDNCGVSIRSLTKLESRTPPEYVKPHNAETISLAFGYKLTEYKHWPAEAKWIVWRAKRERHRSDGDVPQLAAVGTLGKCARSERDLNLHAVTIQTSDGPFELLGLERLEKALTMSKAHAGKVFAVAGNIDQHAPMPSSVSRRLGSPEGDGAIFRLTRMVSRRLPFYASVFVRTADLAEQLMSAFDEGRRVAVVTHVVYDPYQGPWRGFFWIEDGPPKAKKFAFVVDKIVTEIDCKTEKPSRGRSRRREKRGANTPPSPIITLPDGKTAVTEL